MERERRIMNEGLLDHTNTHVHYHPLPIITFSSWLLFGLEQLRVSGCDESHGELVRNGMGW